MAVIELSFLAEMVMKNKPAVIVEIGSYAGGSTMILAEFASRYGGKVFAIDPFHSDNRPKYESSYEAEFDANTARWAHHIEKCKGSSGEIPWQRPIDMLFIDGDHSYEALARDLSRFVPYVKSSGIVALHDYKQSGKVGVRRNVDEKLLGNPGFVPLGTVGSLIAFRKRTVS